MSGRIYFGNSSNKAQKPQKIFVGDSSGKAQLVKSVYVGNSEGIAQKVWPASLFPSAYQRCERLLITANFTKSGNTTYSSGYINTGVKPTEKTGIMITMTTVPHYQGAPDNVSYTQFFADREGYLYMYSYNGGSTSTHDEEYGEQFYYGSSGNIMLSVGKTVKSVPLEYVNSSNGTNSTIIAVPHSILRTNDNELYAKINNSLNWSRLYCKSYFYHDEYAQVPIPTGFNPTVAAFTAKYNLCIPGAVNFHPHFTRYRLRLYRCKIWENKVLIRDFYPCYRKSDSEPGVYDVVNNKFYTNEANASYKIAFKAENKIND